MTAKTEAESLGEELLEMWESSTCFTGGSFHAKLRRLVALATSEPPSPQAEYVLKCKTDGQRCSTYVECAAAACKRAPQAVGERLPLTDERLREIGGRIFGIDLLLDGHLIKFARAIEAALKEPT